MSTRRSRHTGRAFTLIEIMVVISIILVLASLVLGVGSALLRRAERSQVESAMTIMESAFTEWEGQTGRPVTYNGAFNSLTAPTTEIFPSGATLEVFDVREPGTAAAPNNSGNRLIYTRARGAGVFTVNLLAQLESIRPMLAGIPPSMLRAEANTSSYPATNILSGTPSVLYAPSAKSTANSKDSTRSELVDTWGGRIAFVFPGRAWRYGAEPPSSLPDSDGTVRTPAENLLGVCTNRRICLVSAGPDGLFGVPGESTPDSTTIQNTAAADNIYLYELDPPN
jgi:prepilin-type N-terminal cleavage/methylation domain-containing protein